MGDGFEPLNQNEILYINGQIAEQLGLSRNNFSHLAVTDVQLVEALLRKLSVPEPTKKGLFYEGLKVDGLRYGAKNWQSGKIRVKLSVEFCPDEPAVEEPPASNKPEPSEPQSPLDDIRRMIKEENQ
jgi:hypothetical protein